MPNSRRLWQDSLCEGRRDGKVWRMNGFHCFRCRCSSVLDENESRFVGRVSLRGNTIVPGSTRSTVTGMNFRPAMRLPSMSYHRAVRIQSFLPVSSLSMRLLPYQGLSASECRSFGLHILIQADFCRWADGIRSFRRKEAARFLRKHPEDVDGLCL